MAENMIKFIRGNVASLPQTATAGAVYFTKDEGLYLGLADGTYHRYGDFITVNNVESLPESGAHETCMYYCESENILAKWDGTKWVQINKQKTLDELGGVAKSVYEAKVAELEKADADNATAISGVDTRLQAAEEKLKSVATTEGLGDLTDRVTTAEGKITTLEGVSHTHANKDELDKIADGDKAKWDAEIGSAAAIALMKDGTTIDSFKDVEDAIAGVKSTAEQGVADAATAQKKADDAYTLAEGKATMTEVNEAIAGAGHAVKADVDKAISDLDAAYKAADTALQLNIDEKVDQTAYNNKIGDLTAEDARLAGLITAEENARTAADSALDERVTAVETFFVTAEGETLDEALDTLVEIQKYITDEGAAADKMVLDIAANKAATEANAAAIAQEATDRADADNALSERIDAIHTHDNKDVLDGISATKVAAWDAAEQNAKDYTEGLLTWGEF